MSRPIFRRGQVGEVLRDVAEIIQSDISMADKAERIRNTSGAVVDVYELGNNNAERITGIVETRILRECPFCEGFDKQCRFCRGKGLTSVEIEKIKNNGGGRNKGEEI